jgi:hypothetical protein
MCVTDDASMTRARNRCWRTAEYCLIAAAALIALVSALDYAGGWNDGSRLATVESLVDRHTLVIDDSIFVRSPATADAPNPYTPGDEDLRTRGTQDKLLIGGHFYSDKSPLPAFWLAACYQVFQWSTGLVAREHPRLFCYLMTVVSSGIAYVVTVWSVWRLAARKGLPLPSCLLLAASMALATTALPYARHVNNHILLLGVTSLLMFALDCVTLPNAGDSEPLPLSPSPPSPLLPLAAGSLAGVGYTIDLGLGPVLLICTTALVAFRTRSVVGLAGFALAALPWLVAHHAANFYTGGTFGPANSVPEYLAWPGSPFNAQNMTGGWAHATLGHFLLYAAALLFGKHGFINYNLPLYLALVGCAVTFKRRMSELPEIIFAAALSGGGWLLYAALSNNYSGPCCSIRWFLPLLAPAYYVLIVPLRERPAWQRDLSYLSLIGALLCALLWWRGPWEGSVPLLLWPVNAAALIASGIIHARSSASRSAMPNDRLPPANRTVVRRGFDKSAA